MRTAMLCTALGLAVLAGSGAVANDQIYKCIDPNGATLLSDKPCAMVESVPADTAPAVAPAMTAAMDTAMDTAGSPSVAGMPTIEAARPQVRKEHYRLPPAELDHGDRPKVQLVSAPPKVDVATLKAAKLRLELEDKTAGVRQASLD